MGIVEIGVILGCVLELVRLRIHSDERVLLPSPCAFAIVAEDAVPIEILVATIDEVVVDELEGMFSRCPIEATPTAFAFAADVVECRKFLADAREYLTAFPLETYSAHIFAHAWVGKYLLHVVVAVRVEGAHVECHFGMRLSECWPEVFHVESDGSFGCPRTTRIGGVAIGFVLIHHHRDRDAFSLVGIDEAAEVVGVGLQIARVLNEIVVDGEAARKQVLVGVHLLVVRSVGVLEKQEVELRIEVVVLVALHSVVVVDFHP